ncbi:hypothetical protein GS896_27615 [Rhodococcus hoagii]|nr:hypothetical protein [Prescottella equi]MBM4654021.1 hypothetical protein [Prescottella equi]MBM4719718.1 hypothetical protein [Prescottella equi]NKR23513.1 hypothetical protein [Prescottella equi]NKT56333.1 hypothetical protein [Prescottella equi]
MKVYWLRVFSRSDRSVAAIYGTTADGVIEQDDHVYAEWPTATHHIERGVLETADFSDFDGTPGGNTPQAWAEFALTPGGSEGAK